MFFKPITSIHFEYEFWKNMRQPIIKNIIDGSEISLLITPIIGFNQSQQRLGYGLNFYNDYLDKYNHIYTIGLAYDFQRNDEFITDRRDKVINLIITN
jgi:5,10-methenyltetrahydrofolate synthetase